jgi:Holliday junction resolvasome RuvABC endonuclease subunit
MGIDASLRATSVFVVLGDGQTRSFRFGGELEVQSEGEQRDRLMAIVFGIRGLVRDFSVTAAAMEGAAYSMRPNDKLAELRGAIRFALEDPDGMQGRELQVHVVQPNSARAVALGKIPSRTNPKTREVERLRGPELKAWILGRVRVCFPVSTHDDADACVVAEWLALKVGEPSLLEKARAQPGLGV